MKEKTFNNTSTVFKAIKDAEHPFTIVSNYWNDYNKLNGYERAIMLELMSNSQDFVIVKDVIMKRLGFPREKFNTAWNSLKEKHFIFIDKNGKKYGYNIVVREGESVKNETGLNVQKIPTRVYSGEHTLDGQLTNNKKTSNKETSLESLSPKAREQEGIKEPPKQIEETVPVSIPLEMDDTSGGYVDHSFDISNISIEKAKGLSPSISILDNTDMETDFFNPDESVLDFTLYEVPKAKAVEPFHIKQSKPGTRAIDIPQ